MSLHSGDVIMTGTPGGSGISQSPAVFLQPGQTVKVGISGLGEQCQRVSELLPVQDNAGSPAKQGHPAYDWQSIYAPSP